MSRHATIADLSSINVEYIESCCSFRSCTGFSMHAYTIGICTPCEDDNVFRVLSSICDYKLLNPDLNNKLRRTSIRSCTMANVPSLQRITASTHTRMHACMLVAWGYMSSFKEHSTMVRKGARCTMKDVEIWKPQLWDVHGLGLLRQALGIVVRKICTGLHTLYIMFTVTGLIPFQIHWMVSYYTRSLTSDITSHVTYTWHKQLARRQLPSALQTSSSEDTMLTLTSKQASK